MIICSDIMENIHGGIFGIKLEHIRRVIARVFEWPSFSKKMVSGWTEI